MKDQLRKVSVVGLLIALGAFSVSAHDGDKVRARLAGTQEVPVVSTLATGELEANIESDAVTYKLTFEGLEGGNTLFAHIHLGQLSVNGSVMAFLCGGGGKPACPNQSGTVEGTILPADILGLGTQQVTAGGFDEFVRALRNGTAYANVHTAVSPGGEIRGQVKTNHGDRDDDDR
jgi:hypothetical protein